MTGLLAQATLLLLASCAVSGRRLGRFHRWARRERRAARDWQARTSCLWEELRAEVAAERYGRHSRCGERVPATRLLARHGAA